MNAPAAPHARAYGMLLRPAMAATLKSRICIVPVQSRIREVG